MSDLTDHLFNRPAPSLAGVMALADEQPNQWTSAELASILRHQLDAPLCTSGLGIEAAGTDSVAGAEQTAPQSLGELLTATTPSLAWLRRAKDFAKQHLNHADSPLPGEVARSLYFASIVTALLRHGERITELDDAALRQGVEWCLAQIWQDERLHALFQNAVKMLNC